MRKTFAVGRLTPKTTEIVLVHPDEDDRRSPFPGPWSVRAVVRGRTRPIDHATSKRVH